MARNKKEYYKNHRHYGRFILDKSLSSRDPMAQANGFQSAVWEVACRKNKRYVWHTGLCLFKRDDRWRFETTFLLEKPVRHTITDHELKLHGICLDILESQRFETINQAMDAMKMAMDMAHDEVRHKRSA